MRIADWRTIERLGRCCHAKHANERAMQRPLYIGSCRHVKLAGRCLESIRLVPAEGLIRGACNAYSCVIYGRDDRRSENREKREQQRTAASGEELDPPPNPANQATCARGSTEALVSMFYVACFHMGCCAHRVILEVG
jgi:hypothetical protein